MPLFLNFKPNTMTDHARRLFSDLLDVNWQIELNKDNAELNKFLNVAYTSILDQIREEMGANEYKKFIGEARKMFA
jgi:hypothetical protein